mgnify:CR=1 FL=1
MSWLRMVINYRSGFSCRVSQQMVARCRLAIHENDFVIVIRVIRINEFKRRAKHFSKFDIFSMKLNSSKGDGKSESVAAIPDDDRVNELLVEVVHVLHDAVLQGTTHTQVVEDGQVLDVLAQPRPRRRP